MSVRLPGCISITLAPYVISGEGRIFNSVTQSICLAVIVRKKDGALHICIDSWLSPKSWLVCEQYITSVIILCKYSIQTWLDACPEEFFSVSDIRHLNYVSNFSDWNFWFSRQSEVTLSWFPNLINESSAFQIWCVFSVLWQNAKEIKMLCILWHSFAERVHVRTSFSFLSHRSGCLNELMKAVVYVNVAFCW